MFAFFTCYNNQKRIIGPIWLQYSFGTLQKESSIKNPHNAYVFSQLSVIFWEAHIFPVRKGQVRLAMVIYVMLLFIKRSRQSNKGYAISETLALIFYQAMPKEIAMVVLNNCGFIHLLFYHLSVIM